MAKKLKENWVKFEEYDTEQIKTKGSIAILANVKVAWFKDNEGNILAVGDSSK